MTKKKHVAKTLKNLVRNNLAMQNIIFVGYNSEQKIDFTDSDISSKLLPEIQEIEDKLIDINNFDLNNYPLLTDNYCPVDYLTALSLLRQK